MEDKHFYAISDYFSTPVSIELNGTEYLVGSKDPLGDYYRSSMELAFHFIGESNRNLRAYRNDPEFINQELSNLKDKISHLYFEEFNTEFDEKKLIDPELFVSPQDPHVKELRLVYKARLSAYKFSLIKLDKLLSKNQPKEKASENKRIRTKATRYALTLALSEDHFREVYGQMVKNNLIHESSPISDFINAFSGKQIKNKVIWDGGYYRLSLFIRKLNSSACFQEKVHDGIWDIVCDLFIPVNAAYFDPERLAHASKSKNMDYSAIEYIVDDIVEFLTPEH